MRELHFLDRPAIRHYCKHTNSICYLRTSVSLEIFNTKSVNFVLRVKECRLQDLIIKVNDEFIKKYEAK